ASPAPPHQLAFLYRWGAEKERRNGQPGPPAPTGVRLPPGGGKGTPERPARPCRPNRRSFTARGRKRNAGTASPAPPHQLAFLYRWGAEKERRNGQPGPPAPTGVRLTPGGGKGTPERPARPPRTNWRSFTARGRKRNAGTASPAPPAPTGVPLPLGGGKGTPVGSGGARVAESLPGIRRHTSLPRGRASAGGEQRDHGVSVGQVVDDMIGVGAVEGLPR